MAFLAKPGAQAGVIATVNESRASVVGNGRELIIVGSSG